MEEDSAMQDELNAAIELSWRGEREASDRVSEEEQALSEEGSGPMQLVGSPPIPSLLAAAAGYVRSQTGATGSEQGQSPGSLSFSFEAQSAGNLSMLELEEARARRHLARDDEELVGFGGMAGARLAAAAAAAAGSGGALAVAARGGDGDDTGGEGEGGGRAGEGAQSSLVLSIPKTVEEWNTTLETLCAMVTVRPLTAAALDQVQRTAHVILDGKKALKMRRTMVMRKGDVVVACGEGEEVNPAKRGVVESENADGTYMVKWLSPPQETVRVEAWSIRPVHRWGSVAAPSSARLASDYLIQRAIPSKAVEMVEELLRNGADPNVSNDESLTALQLAVLRRCPVPIIASLLRAGADPDAPGPKGSALQMAVTNKELAVVESLLEHGADAGEVEITEAAGCTPEIAEAVRRHIEGSLSEEARQGLQNETIRKLLPLVVKVCHDAPDARAQHNSVGFLSYLVDKLPGELLAEVFPVEPEGEEAKAATEGLYGVMLQLSQGEGCDMLDAIFCLLRILNSFVDKAPAHAPRLRRCGIVRWVERLANAGQTKQDVQAGLLVSKSGRIKDRHISKLASDILSKLPAPSPQDLCADPELLVACELLRQHRPEGFQRLAEVLTSASHTSPNDMAACDVAGALLEALTDRDGDSKAQWTALEAAFGVAKDELKVGEGKAVAALQELSVVGKPTDRLDKLLRPLLELIGTEAQWPVTGSGSDDLAELTRPVRVHLIPRSKPAPDEAAAADAAGAGAGLEGSGGAGSKVQAAHSSAPAIVMMVEPLLRLEELERQLLRTCRPPVEYLAFCHHLVGSTISERPLGSHAVIRHAQVLKFEQQPFEDDAARDGAEPCRTAAAGPAGQGLELDLNTRASCLTIAAEGSEHTVSCHSKGSPAGTIQASRAFSAAQDGPVAYYEATIRKRGPTGAIGVGLARAGYPCNKMPGWEPVSHAWHGDDGCTFNSCGTGSPLSPPWMEGDVIGCGIDFTRSAVFFTRNGALQGSPLRGVDSAGLYATLGFQTKGESVAVNFGPSFLYDIAAHDLSPPQVPVHKLKYLDRGEEEVWVNLLARDYSVLSLPSFSPAVAAIRVALCKLKAEAPPRQARAAIRAMLEWVKGRMSAIAAGGSSCDSVVWLGGLATVRGCPGGREVLEAARIDVDAGQNPLTAMDLCELEKVLMDVDGAEDEDRMACEEDKEAEPVRDQTVQIIIPEGFPAELFFEEVEDAVRQALSQADPTVAPASGQLGDPYRWPDRGFEHEEAWYESLMTALAEHQSGAVARGQTRHEAETLATRLSAVVQCRIATDSSCDYTQRAREAKRSHGPAGLSLSLGDRLQVTTGDGDWRGGTLVVVDAQGRCGVMCDDGVWLPSLPADHVRSLRGGGRGNGGRGRLVPQDLQDVMMQHRMLDQRVLEHLTGGGHGGAVAELRRTFSCFETGDVNRDGYTAPKNRLELWDERQPLPERPSADHVFASAVEAPRVRIALSLPASGGEMVKVKTTQQLHATLEKAQGLSMILFIDAPARPCPGQSWPRPIHSASTLVKDLGQRFGEGVFLRVLSGITPDCLQQFQLPRTGFRPTLVLLINGKEEARWQQKIGLELLWQPVQVCSNSGAPPTTSDSGLLRTVHRNEFVSLVQRILDHQIATGRISAPPSQSVGQNAKSTVHACIQATGASEKPATLTLHYAITMSEGDWMGPGSGGHVGGGEGEGGERDTQGMVVCGGAGSSGAVGQGQGQGQGQEQGQGQGQGQRAGGEWDGVQHAVTPQVRAALEGVRMLHRRFGGRGDGGRWESRWLTKRLDCQLHDALAFASRALPGWCAQLPRMFPFLFSLDSRRGLLDCCAFGSSHALYRFQEDKIAHYRAKQAEHWRVAQQRLARAREQQDIDGISRASDDLDDIERRIYSKRIGAIASDLARVSRDKILEHAQRLMEYHAASKHLLEVQFHGEDGFGSGVTQNFYEAVSVALQRRAVSQKRRLWITDGHDAEHRADPEGPFKYLVNAEGLYPQPLPADTPGEAAAEVEGQFRFIGRLFGKACRDKFTLPLPLHPHFFVVLSGLREEESEELQYQSLELLRSFGRGREEIPAIEEWTSMDLLRAYAAIWDEVEARSAGQGPAVRQAVVAEVRAREFMGSRLNRTFECSLGEFLETSGAAFVDHLSGAPLCEGGAQRDLTVDLLGEYIELTATLWFDTGVRRQMEAFRAGINDVFPFSGLQIFKPAEMELLLCGERRIEWDKESLEQHIKLVGNEQGARYNKKDVAVQLLLDELVEMPNVERAKFLDFVTACPRLPPGGLASLSIEIAPESRSKYPRTRTCSNLMWLPGYTTQGELRECLRAALANAKEGGFHEYNEPVVVRPQPGAAEGGPSGRDR